MFPYIPVTPSKPGMAFKHVDTGEILEFDTSWFSHLDRVEEILIQNHIGDYIEIAP